jgi:hypothetical protein
MNDFAGLGTRDSGLGNEATRFASIILCSPAPKFCGQAIQAQSAVSPPSPALEEDSP